jgi:transcriptional regulator with XRE-family HTH domain
MYILYIKRFRQFRHLTQDELSFLCGIDSSYISRLEADNSIRTRSPKLTVLISLAKALKVCPTDLLTYSCQQCEQYETCTKRKYVEKDNENFFENNLSYYL